MFERSRLAIVGVNLVLAGAAAQASPQTKFDLDCRGIEAGLEIDGKYQASPNTNLEPVRLVIDLDQKVWCYSNCRKPGSLNVEPLKLELEGGPRGLGLGIGFVDRQTGSYTEITELPTEGIKGFLTTSYVCKRAPFSGLPTRKF